MGIQLKPSTTIPPTVSPISLLIIIFLRIPVQSIQLGLSLDQGRMLRFQSDQSSSRSPRPFFQLVLGRPNSQFSPSKKSVWAAPLGFSSATAVSQESSFSNPLVYPPVLAIYPLPKNSFLTLTSLMALIHRRHYAICK